MICLPMVLMQSCTPELQKILTDVLVTEDGGLTEGQIGQGLKEALTQGISNGSDLVSQLDGYYKNPEIKVLFPPQAAKIEKKLTVNSVRFSKANTLNSAAAKVMIFFVF